MNVDSDMIHFFDNDQGSGSGNGWIELVLIEGRDLVAADLRGTSDPYVRVHYGNYKKRTKVGIKPNLDTMIDDRCFQYYFSISKTLRVKCTENPGVFIDSRVFNNLA